MNDHKTKYSHQFVETYDGFLGFGWDRQTDESSTICYLQMVSNDELMKSLVNRLSDDEIQEIQMMISTMLKKHLSDDEYHRLFLKDHAG
jgi:hypothetical protein